MRQFGTPLGFCHVPSTTSFAFRTSLTLTGCPRGWELRSVSSQTYPPRRHCSCSCSSFANDSSHARNCTTVVCARQVDELPRRKESGKEDASDLLVQFLHTFLPLLHVVSQQYYVVLASFRRQPSGALTTSEFVTRHLRLVGNPRPHGFDLVEFSPQLS